MGSEAVLREHTSSAGILRERPKEIVDEESRPLTFRAVRAATLGISHSHTAACKLVHARSVATLPRFFHSNANCHLFGCTEPPRFLIKRSCSRALTVSILLRRFCRLRTERLTNSLLYHSEPCIEVSHLCEIKREAEISRRIIHGLTSRKLPVLSMNLSTRFYTAGGPFAKG